MGTNMYKRDAWLLYFGITLFFCIGLGARPYLTPSEARYIELPRQMLATGDWLTPRINGVPYFEKPPLFYWLQAIALGLFGTGEFAGRIVTVLFTALTCVVTYATGRMLFGRVAGLIAAGVLATSLMGYSLSRVSTLDVPVSFFITVCFACFLTAQQHSKRFYYLMYAASALSVMTKGLIGIVVPGLVIGAYILLTRQWHILKEARLPTGLCIFLTITVPWHYLMAQRHADFLQFYFIHEHFTRYLTDEHKRAAPWWFFIAVTVAGFLPWTFFTVRLQRKHAHDIFLYLWILLPLVFFSTSHSKLVPYIFPIFPPIAILIGRRLSEFWSGADAKPLRIHCAVIVLLFVTLLGASRLLSALPGKLGVKIAAATTDITLLMLLPIAIMLLVLALALLRSSAPRMLICLLGGLGITIGISANYITAGLDKSSIKHLVQELKTTEFPVQPNDIFIAYGSYWQDLPVYLNRNIVVAGWTGELYFGVEHYPETKKWMIDTDTFWRYCTAAPHAVYIFAREGDMGKLGYMPEHKDCLLRTLGHYGNTYLLEKIIP